MSDPVRPLDEATGRATKDFMIETLADTTRQLGALPMGEHLEKVAQTVVKTVEINREETIRQESLPKAHPDPKPGALPVDFMPDGLIVPDSWDEKRRAEWAFEQGPVEATVTIDRHTGKVMSVRYEDGAKPEERAEPPQWQARRRRLRYLLSKPEWRERITKVFDAPGMTLPQREDAWEQIYQDSIRYYGDPMKPRERKPVSMPSLARRVVVSSPVRPEKLLGKR